MIEMSIEDLMAKDMADSLNGTHHLTRVVNATTGNVRYVYKGQNVVVTHTEDERLEDKIIRMAKEKGVKKEDIKPSPLKTEYNGYKVKTYI